MTSTLIIPMPGNEALAQRLSRTGRIDLGAIETRRFPDGETYLRHLTALEGREVAIICTLTDPDPKLVPLLLAAGSARRLGARRVGLVAPYLAYMRQDREFHPGEAVSAVHFANLVSEHFDWLATIDPHLHRIRGLAEVFRVPTDVAHAAPVLALAIREQVSRPLLVGPDSESRLWVSGVAAEIGAPFVIASKRRLGDRSVEISLPDLTPWSDRTPVLVDDVASSGQTLMELARLLDERSMPRPVAAVVHGLFAGDSLSRLKALCSIVLSTNTIPNPSGTIDVSGIVAGQIKRLSGGST